MREQLIRALLAHAQGEIEMHKANVEVYLTNPVGIGEHPDVTQAIQEEIDKIARWHDQIEVIQKYFKGSGKT
jgi:methyl coenzyme M reductase gamma subunit